MYKISVKFRKFFTTLLRRVKRSLLRHVRVLCREATLINLQSKFIKLLFRAAKTKGPFGLVIGQHVRATKTKCSLNTIYEVNFINPLPRRGFAKRKG